MQVDDIFLSMTEAMTKAVDHVLHEFTTLHTGKASPGMVEPIVVKVESYGSSMPIRDIAAVTTPDARTIVIQPWDKGVLRDIERGIQEANLGINPVISGTVIRLPIPELSGERRKELAKVAHKMAEEGRISVRSARRDAMDAVKKLQKDGDISEDVAKRHEKDIQEETDMNIEQINTSLEEKEKELTTV
jgi:ribosome recycling factor